MAFGRLHRDTVTLVKQNGRTIGGIKASVQSRKILIFVMNMAEKTTIEPGDIIQRRMSIGGEETFEVINPVFNEKRGGIPANYQIEVRRLGIPEARNRIQQVTYNVSGSNARINQNSIDRSINVVGSDPGIAGKLEELRLEISKLVEDENQRTNALSIVDAVADQFASDSPNRAAVNVLLKALPAVGNVASIGSFLLSCLA